MPSRPSLRISFRTMLLHLGKSSSHSLKYTKTVNISLDPTTSSTHLLGLGRSDFSANHGADLECKVSTSAMGKARLSVMLTSAHSPPNRNVHATPLYAAPFGSAPLLSPLSVILNMIEAMMAICQDNLVSSFNTGQRSKHTMNCEYTELRSADEPFQPHRTAVHT